MWKIGFVSFFCIVLAGEVWAAPVQRKSKKKTQKRRVIPKKKTFKLPQIPMLRVRKRSKTGTLPIFRRDAIRGLKVRKKRVHRKRKRLKRRRLPPRPPQRVKRIKLQAPAVRRMRVPVLQAQGRHNVKVRPLASDKDKGLTVQLTIHRHSLDRHGLLRRWRGHILIHQGRLRYRCALHSFCRTLRLQLQRLLRNGLRYKGKTLTPRHPKFHWVLRQALEQKYGYAVVSKVK